MSETQAAPTGNSNDGAAEKPEGVDDMADKKKDGETEICDADMKEKEGEQKEAKDAEEMEKKKKEAEDKAAKDKDDEMEEEKEAKDAEEKEKKEKGAMDAAIKGLAADVAALKATTVKTLMTELNQRNKIAGEAAAIVGTFDHAELTTSEVIKYALDKVGVKAPAGQEQAAWDGFMAGRKASGASVSFSLDAAMLKPDSLVAATLRDSQ
jgi:hypothetical protein